MSRQPEKKRYIVSDVGFGFAVHDTREEKTYYKGVDPSPQSGPKGRIVEICPNRETAYRVAHELNEAERARGAEKR